MSILFARSLDTRTVFGHTHQLKLSAPMNSVTSSNIGEIWFSISVAAYWVLSFINFDHILDSAGVNSIVYALRSVLLTSVALLFLPVILTLASKNKWILVIPLFLTLNLFLIDDPTQQLRGIAGIWVSVCVVLVALRFKRSFLLGIALGTTVLGGIALGRWALLPDTAHSYTRNTPEHAGQIYFAGIAGTNLSLSVAVGILFSLLLGQQLKYRRLNWVTLVISTSFTYFIMSQTKSATILVSISAALLTFIVVAAGRTFPSSFRIYWGVAGGLLLVIASLGLGGSSYGLEVLFRLTGRSGLSGREDLWDQAIQMYRDSPPLGVGLADFGFSVHNLYLTVLLYGGALGLLYLLSLIFAAFLGGFLRNQEILPPLVFCVVAAASISDPEAPSPFGLVMLWLIAVGFESLHRRVVLGQSLVPRSLPTQKHDVTRMGRLDAPCKMKRSRFCDAPIKVPTLGCGRPSGQGRLRELVRNSV